MRRKQSSNFFGFLSSLFIFLFIRDIQARKLQQVVCSSSCGDIKNIGNPFRLKGDPPGCGDAAYELSCQSNKTILEFHSGKYYVKRISYDQHLITVVDYKLANGTCGLPYKSLSSYDIDLLAYDRYVDSYRYDVTDAIFLRCSSKINNQTYIRLPCLNQNESYVYVHGVRYELDLSELPKSCSFLSSVPIDAPSSVDYQSFQKFLQSGFDLAWSVECKNCRSAGRLCSMDQNNDECYKYSKILAVLQFLAPLILVLVANILLHVIISTLLDFLFILCSFFTPLLWITYPSYLGFVRFESFYIWFSQTFHWWPYIYTKGYSFFIIGNFFALLTGVIITRIILIMVLVVFLTHKYKTTKKTVDDVEKFLYNQQSWMPKRYSYIEIIAITNHFRDKLGQGGFGTVYKAQLLNGSLVAIKVLKNSKFSGEEFINEVSTIGRIHHSNVVRLVGFCSEGSKRALVYEYMPNGSLDSHIFSKKGSGQSFSWEKLHEIALGTARGIEYLHNGCDMCILHFDIKPHNILLDHNFVPKVADFGLAKFYPKENNFICVSATRGTIGYIAPELVSRNFGAITCKSDVYSFGMLLLEMAGGRRNSFAKATRSSKAYFPSWVYDRIIEGRELKLQDVSEIEEVIARKLCIIGLWCIQVNTTARPSITKVVEMLEGNIDDLQMPPKPFFSSSSKCNSIREIQSDSSTELLEYSESTE